MSCHANHARVHKTHFVDGIQNELAEPADKALSPRLVPLAGSGRVELVAPKTFHQLGRLDLELVGVHFRNLLHCEGPPVKARAKANCAIAGVHHDVAHGTVFISIGGHNNIQGLHYSPESLVQILLFQLCTPRTWLTSPVTHILVLFSYLQF